MISHKLIFLFSCFAASILSTNAENEQPKLHVFEGVIRYNLHKSDLDRKNNERCAESPEFELHYVPWKIRACIEEPSGDSVYYLMVTLIAVFKGETEAWSCEAEANFEVLAKEPYNSAHMRIGNTIYDSAHPSSDKKKLVEWNKLLTRHMIDDIATIDVTMKVKPPNKMKGIQHASTKFQMRISEVNKLNYLYSEEATVRGIRWKALALKQNEHLAVAVAVNEDDMDFDYAWNVSAKFHLLSLEPGKTVTKSFSDIQFDWTTTNYGFNKFIKWTDVMDSNKKFVIGNSALLQIELKVGKPKPKENSQTKTEMA